MSTAVKLRTETGFVPIDMRYGMVYFMIQGYFKTKDYVVPERTFELEQELEVEAMTALKRRHS